MASRYLYLVRHGEYHHWQDPPLPECGRLTRRGRRQSRITGKALARLPDVITHLHTSNMPRALDTTEEILPHLGDVKVARTSMLRECLPCLTTFMLDRPGILHGASRSSAFARLRTDEEYRKVLAERWQRTQKRYAPNETRPDKAFKRFFRPTRGEDRHEVIVAHGNVIRYLCCRVLDVVPEAWGGFGTHNCGITRVEVLPGGKFHLHSYNETGHLPPSIRT